MAKARGENPPAPSTTNARGVEKDSKPEKFSLIKKKK